MTELFRPVGDVFQNGGAPFPTNDDFADLINYPNGYGHGFGYGWSNTKNFGYGDCQFSGDGMGYNDGYFNGNNYNWHTGWGQGSGYVNKDGTYDKYQTGFGFFREHGVGIATPTTNNKKRRP